MLAALSTHMQGNVPACCRRDGKHHCMMQMTPASHSGTTISSPLEKCPFFPKGILFGTTRIQLSTPSSEAIFYAAIQSRPAIFVQTLARYRISHDRSRLKRGPPAIL